ncbi:hypothetical protein DIPPA_70111 [Diplonema papillatum]|nr:hypothetical protein DIPPA_70111 [Diplonema papillatum]
MEKKPERDIIGVFKIPGDRTCRVLVGDITSEKVGTVVVANNATLQYASGSAWEIVGAGGNIIRDETDMYTAKFGNIKAGECVVSGAGHMPSSNVVHVVLGRWEQAQESNCLEVLKRAVTNALKLCTKLGHPSVAITPLGVAGEFRYPPTKAVPSIVKAVQAYFAENTASPVVAVHLIAPGRAIAEMFAAQFGKQKNKDATKEPAPNQSGQKRPSTLYYRKACVTKPFETQTAPVGSNIIVHFVSPGKWSTRGCMGRITRKFGSGPEQACVSSKQSLGTVVSYKIPGSDIVVASVMILTMEHGKPVFCSDHFKEAMTFIATNAAKHRSHVHIHRPPEDSVVKLDWAKAHRLLTDVFQNIPVTVYTVEESDLNSYTRFCEPVTKRPVSDCDTEPEDDSPEPAKKLAKKE